MQRIWRGTIQITLGLFLLWLPAASLAADKPKPVPGEDIRHRTHLQIFKDWMLTQCIRKAYAASPTAEKDASESGAIYMEFGTFGMEEETTAYRAIIAEYLARDYRGSPDLGDAKFDLAKCIDLYHSSALDKLARKNSGRPFRTHAQDER